MTLSRAARALAAPLLLMAFVRCSAGELEPDPADTQASPAVEQEQANEPGSDPELSGEAGLSEEEEEEAEPAAEAELELGQLAQPLIDGAPCFFGTVACRNRGVAQRCVGGRVVSLPCPANTACSNGQCLALPRVCAPNSRTCSGNALQTCNSQGTGFTTTQCVGGFCTPQGCIFIR